MRILGLVLANSAIVLLLLLSINFLSAIFLSANRALNVGSGANDKRIDLPVNADRELATRIFDEFHRLRFEYEPYAGWRRVSYQGVTTKIDESGRRVTPQPDGATLPIVQFFGGSTMWGTGVQDSETIPAHFARLSGLRTVNNGQSGFVSRQNLAALLNVLDHREQLDVAVFYDGVNDVAVLCRSADATGHIMVARMRQDLFQSGVDRRWLWDSLFGATQPFLLRAINKMSVLAGKGPLFSVQATPSLPPICRSDPEHAERVADAMIANWRRAKLLLLNEGRTFVGVLQPVAFIGSARTDHLEYENNMLGDYEAVYPIIRQKLVQQSEITFVDLTTIFDHGEPVYMDWAHVNSRGNERIAAALHAALGRGAIGTRP